MYALSIDNRILRESHSFDLAFESGRQISEENPSKLVELSQFPGGCYGNPVASFVDGECTWISQGD